MSGEEEKNVGVAAVDELAEHIMADVPGPDDAVAKAEDAELAAQALAETEQPAEKPEETSAQTEVEGSEAPEVEKPEVKPEETAAVEAEEKAAAEETEAQDDRDAAQSGVIKDLQTERGRRREETEAKHKAELAQARAEAKLEALQEFDAKPAAEQTAQQDEGPKTPNEVLAALREREGLTGTDALNLDQMVEYNEGCDELQKRSRQRSFEQSRDQFVKSNRASVDAAIASHTEELAGKGRSFLVVTGAGVNLLTDPDKEKIKASDNVGEALYSTCLERLTEAGLCPAPEKPATQENKDKETDKPKATGERQPQTGPTAVPDQETILSHEDKLTAELFAAEEPIKPEDLD